MCAYVALGGSRENPAASHLGVMSSRRPGFLCGTPSAGSHRLSRGVGPAEPRASWKGGAQGRGLRAHWCPRGDVRSRARETVAGRRGRGRGLASPPCPAAPRRVPAAGRLRVAAAGGLLTVLAARRLRGLGRAGALGPGAARLVSGHRPDAGAVQDPRVRSSARGARAGAGGNPQIGACAGEGPAAGHPG